MEAATPQTVTVTEAAAGNDAIDDATVTTQSLPVPRSVVGHIIGKGGVNIKKTQEVSGCRVKITDASDGGGGGDESSESSFWAYARLRGYAAPNRRCEAPHHRSYLQPGRPKSV